MNKLTLEPARWQFSLSDAFVFVMACGAGITLLAPLLREMRYPLGDIESLALVVGLAVLAAPLAIQHCRFLPDAAAIRPWMLLLYIAGAWDALLLPCIFGLGALACLLALTFPGFILGCIHSRRNKYSGWSACKHVLLSTATGMVIIGIFTWWVVPSILPIRIATRENSGIAAFKTFAEAQDIYRRTDWDDDGELEYAQRITGDDSLYETKTGSGDIRLVNFAFARASQGLQPWAGYYFKILSGQGPNASGGRRSYLIPGADGQLNLTLGYGLLGWPAQYGVTGRNTFQINNTGTVYQKDLGPNTVNLVAIMSEYDPDSTWVVAE
ncbi:MAG: DUF2950 family protein [Planctomycetota bacterium]|nr:DUF2950 family protein [Planctomycetota bacterium]